MRRLDIHLYGSARTAYSIYPHIVYNTLNSIFKDTYFKGTVSLDGFGWLLMTNMVCYRPN
jgi:hypothetical protein